MDEATHDGPSVRTGLRPRMGGRALALGVVLAIALGAAVPATGVAKPRSARADLSVQQLLAPSGPASAGTALRVRDTVRNRGRSTAGASQTRYYLSRDRRKGRGDVRLRGSRKVGKLRRGRRDRGFATLRVPAGAKTARYLVIACADGSGRVRERREGDNCSAARGRIAVTGGAPGDDTSMRTQALSDVFGARDELDLPLDSARLASEKATICASSGGKRTPGHRGAVARLTKFLARKAGKSALRAFRRSPHARKPLRAQQAAALAISDGKPGAALAALLRAHELEPREPSHLANAAAVATSVGRPAEALGLLRRARQLPDHEPAAADIPLRAVIDANKGHALASLSRWKQAERSLGAAERREPLLEAEAAAGKAAASLCIGSFDRAVELRQRARRRHDADPAIADGAELDRLGQPTEMRRVPLPTDPAVAASWGKGGLAGSGPYAQMSDGVLARIWELNGRRNELRRAAVPVTPTTLAERYRHGLASELSAVATIPEDLSDDAAAKLRQTHDTRTDLFIDGQVEGVFYRDVIDRARDECSSHDDYSQCFSERTRAYCRPLLASYHQRFQAEFGAAHDAAARRLAWYSRRVRAQAARTSHPATRDWILVRIDSLENAFFSGLVQTAGYWADWYARSGCYDEPTPRDVEQPGELSHPPTPECPQILGNPKAHLKLGGASLKVNCEGMSVSGSTPGWIGGFGEVSFDPKAGTVVVWGGARGGLKGVGMEADFKSGFYMKFGAADGGLQDIGWRVGPSVDGGAGLVEFGASDTVDFSFVGAFSAPHPR